MPAPPASTASHSSDQPCSPQEERSTPRTKTESAVPSFRFSGLCGIDANRSSTGERVRRIHDHQIGFLEPIEDLESGAVVASDPDRHQLGVIAANDSNLKSFRPEQQSVCRDKQ